MTKKNVNNIKNSYKFDPYSWYIVIVLQMMYTLSFIDRQILAIFVGPIKQDMGISDFAFSLLSGFAFAIFYTFFGLPFARIADSRSRRGLIAFGVAFWSGATVACGMAKGYWHLFLARIGVGIGEATLTPAANSLIADYFPKEKLGRALAVYTLGIPLGSAIAFVLGGVVVDLVEDLPPQDLALVGRVYGWQLAFLIVGLPGLPMAALMFTIREPIRRGRLKRESSSRNGLPIRRVILFMSNHARAYTALFFGSACLAVIYYGIMLWIIAFYTRTHGISAGEAAMLFGLVLAVFGIGGIILGGAWADRRIASGQSDGPLRVLLWAALLTLPTGIIFPLISNIWGATVVMSFTILAVNMPIGTVQAAIMAITPNEIRGQASAINLFITNLIGLGAGPSIIAGFTDYFYNDEALLNYAISTSVAFVVPIASVLFIMGMSPYRSAMAEQNARENHS